MCLCFWGGGVFVGVLQGLVTGGGKHPAGYGVVLAGEQAKS